MRIAAVILALVAGLGATPAMAYVGPGLGMGAIGVFLALVGAVFLALYSLIAAPIRRLWRKLRGRGPDTAPQGGDDD